RVTVPWFAVGFVLVIGFNSLDLLPQAMVDGINTFDTFLLTMAMTALGAETSIDKFKKAGSKPFVLAAVLYVWLFFGGYLLVKHLAPLLA
ncbi:MAG TPA: putative sulfate exporter family transporter, partial [Candidatus Avibacteroides faecavium]|nr:putative sulfate exporter family transporter [Candidatus Avibacteroides faecavium]